MLVMVSWTENIERWLAVHYWEMVYEVEAYELEDRASKRKVTFKDEDDVQEIETEHQIYAREENELRLKSRT